MQFTVAAREAEVGVSKGGIFVRQTWQPHGVRSLKNPFVEGAQGGMDKGSLFETVSIATGLHLWRQITRQKTGTQLQAFEATQ